MAAYTVTPASVLKGSSAKTDSGTAGETITAGMAVYKKAADSKWYKSDANAASPANTVDGIALNGASAGQPLDVVVSDTDFTVGATLTAGDVIVVGGTAAGDLAPVADLASGWYPLVVGVATSTTKARINCSSNGLKGTAALA